MNTIDEINTPETENEEQISEARKERAIIFHLLYAMDASEYESSIASVIDNLNRGFEQEIKLDGEEARITQAIIDDRDQLDEFIKPLLSNWRLERVGMCTKLVLRLAVWELLNTKLEPKIILNEAIELAKCFSEKDAYRFVNGVLDEALKRLNKPGLALDPS